MVVEFKCPKCGKTVSLEQRESNRFCPNCGTFLQPKRLRLDRQINMAIIKPKEIKLEDVNLDSLFYQYLHFRPIDVGGGVVFKNVGSWISSRKRVYKEYREKFSPNKLHDIEMVVSDFKKWLLFRNNLSWTTFQRTGYKALENPEKLTDLLFLLQNEDINVATKVKRGLLGKEKVKGIGQGILTALLHTFYDDKYGVWNSRTKDTLEILRRSPIRYSHNLHIGQIYNLVNNILLKMTKELKTDLTTIDGFMWYISKHVRFI